jgi:hypothetical protein
LKALINSDKPTLVAVAAGLIESEGLARCAGHPFLKLKWLVKHFAITGHDFRDNAGHVLASQGTNS